MKAWDFEAVTYDGAIYCTECLPEGITADHEEVGHIFATDEEQWPGATCDACGTVHDYMGILGNPPYWAYSIICGALDEEEFFTTASERDTWIEKHAEELHKVCPDEDWQIYRADVTPGCSAGEYAGEEATVVHQNSASA